MTSPDYAICDVLHDVQEHSDIAQIRCACGSAWGHVPICRQPGCYDNVATIGYCELHHHQQAHIANACPCGQDPFEACQDMIHFVDPISLGFREDQDLTCQTCHKPA